MFCRCCGKEIGDHENYCRYCGAKIKKEIGMKTKYWEAFILFICLCALVVVGVVSIKLHDAKETAESSAYEDERMDSFTDFEEGPENNNIEKYDYVGDYNEDGIAVAQLDGYYGFVDDQGNERTDFVYEYAENFVGDLALVKKDGYYGYINKQGDTAIGFMYDEATSFDADYHLAIVKTGNGKGVIDEIGSFIVNPHYTEVYFDSGFIVTVISQDTIGSIDKCGVYTVSGSHIIEDIYTGFYFINEKIYATEHDSLGTLFDYYGNNLLNSEELQGALEISPPINGVSIAKYDSGISYSAGFAKNKVTYFLYYDTELKPIIDKKLSWTTYFNKLGYAIARYSAINDLENIDKEDAIYSGYEGHEFAIIRSDGAEELRIPEPDYNEEYVDVNDFYVLVHSNSRPASDMLLDRASFQRIPCYNPTMVDGTNCIIVQDKDSGLYGLYDGLSITKKCIYNDISFHEEGGFFTLIRGSEEEEYIPVSALQNET